MEDYASEKQTVGQSRWQDEANDLEHSLKDGVMPFETDSQPTGILPHPQAAHVDSPAGNLSFQPLPADPHTVGDPLSRNSKQAPSLASCRLCRQRKIKCDRTIPCSNCVRVGEDCMPIVRSKVPRGRQGGRKRKTDGELLERIAKLENLVKDIEGSPSAHGTTSQHVDSGLSSLSVRDGPAAGYSNGAGRSGAEKDGATTYQGRNDIDRYLGASFFLALTDGIGGLKDVLEGSSDDEDEPELGQGLEAGSMKSAQEQLQHSNDPGLIIFPSLSAESPSGPTPHQLYTFCEIYLTNVDPVFKILHAPSLRRFLQEGAPELDCSPGLRGLEALKLAICYTATLSMAEGECRHRMGEERAVLMAKYRACTEQALAKADLVNTVEMSTLQAMTIYLAAVRSSDTRRVMWTLTSLAIRIAQAMGLHHENTSSSLKPFAREMRRRLWWQLCLLDSHAASDRASNPVISADSFSTKLPLGINDEDFHIDSLVVEEQDSFNAMTFPLICYEIFDIVRQLNFVPARDLGQPQHGYQENFPQRIDAVVRLQQRIQERYLRHLNLSRPFHWTTRVIADIITASMWLIVYRPLQKRPGSIPSSQIADPGILRLSVEILEKAYQLDTDPAASPYRWISQTYVQWHALAVTTAELCVKTEGPLVERAWVILQPIFELASRHVADSSEGMLWRPVKRLMCRAERVRQEYLSSGSAKVDSSATVTDGSLPDQGSYQTITEDLMVGTARHEQQALAGYVPHMEGLQQTSYVPTSVPFDWGPWLATASIPMETPVQTQFNDDLDQMSWNNWEDFVNDFQG